MVVRRWTLAEVLDIITRAKSVIEESADADEHADLLDEVDTLVDSLMDAGSQIPDSTPSTVIVTVRKRGVQ